MSNRREVGDVKPSSLNHLIGQHGVTDQVRVAIDAAHMDGKKWACKKSCVNLRNGE